MKIVQNLPTPLLVVAAALIDDSGRILMQRRRLSSAHGGLWEFPGGKVEPGESPESALVREIEEELGLGLSAAALRPLTFASGQTEADWPIVLMLYTCQHWIGTEQCRDAEEIGWFAPDALNGLEMPPLDYPLADALVRQMRNNSL